MLPDIIYQNRRLPNGLYIIKSLFTGDAENTERCISSKSLVNISKSRH